jgi:hypothetical protein
MYLITGPFLMPRCKRGDHEEQRMKMNSRERVMGGYMMSSGNSLASYLKPECIVAMTRAIQRYGRYPIELG